MATVASVHIAGSCSRRENPREIVLISNFGHSGDQSAEKREKQAWFRTG
jgi:hypothetical protein